MSLRRQVRPTRPRLNLAIAILWWIAPYILGVLIAYGIALMFDDPPRFEERQPSRDVMERCVSRGDGWTVCAYARRR